MAKVIKYVLFLLLHRWIGKWKCNRNQAIFGLDLLHSHQVHFHFHLKHLDRVDTFLAFAYARCPRWGIISSIVVTIFHCSLWPYQFVPEIKIYSNYIWEIEQPSTSRMKNSIIGCPIQATLLHRYVFYWKIPSSVDFWIYFRWLLEGKKNH